MEKFIEKTKYYLGLDINRRAFNDTLLFSTFDKIHNKGSLTDALINIEVDTFTKNQMESQLIKNSNGIVELYSGGLRNEVKTIFNNIENINKSIMTNIKEIHIAKSNINMIKVKIKNSESINNSKIAYINLNVYQNQLVHYKSIVLYKYTIASILVFAGFIGYKIYGIEVEIKKKNIKII